MYEELVKRLRETTDNHDEKCESCPYVEEYPCCVDCLDKMHIKAANAIEKFEKSIPRWIPVTEDSPKEGFPILGAFKFQGGNGCIVTERITINGEEIWSAAMGMEPFAWMPLPELPKEET